jgi:hypothetical protein
MSFMPFIPKFLCPQVYGTGFKEHACAGGWCNLAADWPPAGYDAKKKGGGTSAAHAPLSAAFDYPVKPSHGEL